jgi:hypothetical protein
MLLFTSWRACSLELDAVFSMKIGRDGRRQKVTKGKPYDFAKSNLLKSSQHCLDSLLDAIQLSDTPVVLSCKVALLAGSQWASVLVDLESFSLKATHQLQFLAVTIFLDPFSL